MKKIKDISAVKLIQQFDDDHLLCAEISFKDQDGKGHKLELYWIHAEGIGACLYANDSLKAKRDLIKMINAQYKIDEEDAGDADAAMGVPNP